MHEKRKLKFKRIRVYLSIVAAGLILIWILLFTSLGEGLFENSQSTDKSTWSYDQLVEKEEVEYTVVDNGIFETEESLASWYKEIKDEEGLHYKSNDGYTYVAVKGDKNTSAIQLYDVRKDEDAVYVGYTFVEEESDDTDHAEPFMVLRFDHTNKNIYGKKITN